MAKEEYDACINRLNSTSLWELIEDNVIYCIYKTLGNLADLSLRDINRKISSINWDDAKREIFYNLQDQNFYGFNLIAYPIDSIHSHIDFVLELALLVLEELNDLDKLRREYGYRVDDIANQFKKFYNK
ncbi:MAG: hypothetical protein EU532_09615 [Promethearchaeota archaeon]|nr:MAG: hypothetical protein EU532_09615 [Candidatus Lokiarchaeota archaeon]